MAPVASQGIQKTRDAEKKSRRLLEPAVVWTEHGVVQRQESHMLYYRAMKSIFYVSLRTTILKVSRM